MTTPSLLEQAANVREQAAACRRVISDLRDRDHPHWTTFALLVQDLEAPADVALRTAWSALQRLEQLANEILQTSAPP